MQGGICGAVIGVSNMGKVYRLLQNGFGLNI
jgi:hypothetical protein